MKGRGSVTLGVIVMMALVGCGGGAEDALRVQDPWVRPAPIPGGNGAGYMVIENNTDEDDALLQVEADFAEAVEIHQTMVDEMNVGEEGESEMQEMVMMAPVEAIDVPAGSSANLEPGGYHVMLFGIEERLEPGQTVTLTLRFEKAGEIEIEAEVRQG